jgi:hypothetical protein
MSDRRSLYFAREFGAHEAADAAGGAGDQDGFHFGCSN